MVGQTVRMIDASVAVSAVSVSTTRSVPKSATAIGLAVATKGAVPRQLGLSRSALEANGFEGKAGQILVVPTGGETVIAIGVGDPGAIDANGLRRSGRSVRPGGIEACANSRRTSPISTTSMLAPPARRWPKASCWPRTATSG